MTRPNQFSRRKVEPLPPCPHKDEGVPCRSTVWKRDAPGCAKHDHAAPRHRRAAKRRTDDAIITAEKIKARRLAHEQVIVPRLEAEAARQGVELVPGEPLPVTIFGAAANFIPLTPQEAMRQVAMANAEAIAQLHLDIINDTDEAAEIRMRASDRLLDRVYGKPRVAAEVRAEGLSIIDLIEGRMTTGPDGSTEFIPLDDDIEEG